MPTGLVVGRHLAFLWTLETLDDLKRLGSTLPVQGTNEYVTMYVALSKLSLNYSWWAKYYKIRASSRVLPYIDPSRVWINPLQRDDHVHGIQFWPPPRRGPGINKDADDNDSDDDHGSGSGEASDDDTVAERREVNAQLDESLLAIQQAMIAAHKDKHPDEHVPDEMDAAGGPPDESSDSSSSSDESSSTNTDEAPPDAPAEAPPDAAALRGTADVVVNVTGGVIRWYRNKQQFTAECTKHDSCVKTRTSLEAKAMTTAANPTANTAAKGRPVGYLAAWLASGCHHACTDKDLHWSPPYEPTWQQRKDARAAVAALPEGEQLLSKERPQRAGEEPEPAGMP
jgi:hypothetical protein